MHEVGVKAFSNICNNKATKFFKNVEQILALVLFLLFSESEINTLIFMFSKLFLI